MSDDAATAGRVEEQLTSDFGYFMDKVEVIADLQSEYQHIQILATATFGTVLRLDGALQCSERDEFFYHEPLVHMAVAHTAPCLRLLIVGGGDGGAAEEALKWPCVQHLDHVEIDALVLDLYERHLRAVHHGVLSGTDARYHQHVGDGAAWVRRAVRQALRYDAVILDLTDAGGPSSALYGPDFYRQCSSLLSPDGVLTLHVAAPWAQQTACSETVSRLRDAFAFVEPYVVSVPLSGGQWLMAACHNQRAPLGGNVDTLQSTLSQLHGPALKVVDAGGLKAMLHLPPYLAEALSRGA